MTTHYPSVNQPVPNPIPILYEPLPPEWREYYRIKAAENALSIGLTAETWRAMRRGHECRSDLMMAVDPEGERLRLNKK